MTEIELGRMGRITLEGKIARIEFERHFNHSQERIWKAITSQEQLSKWYLCKVKIEGGEDGRIDLWFGKTHVYGLIRTWEPPFILEHEWNIDPHPGLLEGERTTLRWELEDDGKGTLVRLSHINLSKNTALGFSDELAPATSDHVQLDRLEAFLNSTPVNVGLDHILSVREAYRKLGWS